MASPWRARRCSPSKKANGWLGVAKGLELIEQRPWWNAVEIMPSYRRPILQHGLPRSTRWKCASVARLAALATATTRVDPAPARSLGQPCCRVCRRWRFQRRRIRVGNPHSRLNVMPRAPSCCATAASHSRTASSYSLRRGRVNSTMSPERVPRRTVPLVASFTDVPRPGALTLTLRGPTG